MKIEIDQSGKIEETEKDTILAFCVISKKLKKTKSIRISARTKRRIQESFRQIGKPREFVINVFACAVFILIKNELMGVSEISIDIEYPGKDIYIKPLLTEMFLRSHVKVPLIRFALIGKKSIAHEVALKTYRKRIKADEILNYNSLIKNIFTTKNGCPTLKYQVSDKR